VQPSIRNATVADAPAIAEMVCRVARETIFADGPAEGLRYFLAMNSDAAVAGKMGSGAYRYFVAEREGDIVGMAAMLNNAHLYHLFVETSEHGKGIGRLLWDHAQADARSRGNPGRFTVNATPDSIGVYERFGFKVSGDQQVRNGHAAVPMTLDSRGGR
jgi:GNAT superfamily N-acetyltransferase